VKAADIRPIAPSEQTQSSLDLFLIFVGANMVATTFQVGASLAPSFSARTAAVLIVAGSILGAALVAVLAPIGSRLRVPSIIAARPALGIRGAGVVAIVLYVSNFAWIALNNVIAASACARATGVGSPAGWAVGLGLLATVVVWRGPRAVALADRAAVPLMLLVAVALSVACWRVALGPASALATVSTSTSSTGLGWSRGLDVVIGYQVSWILMFADYPRYTKSAKGSTVAVFAALALTSIWMMPLGAIAARAAGSNEPGAMLVAVGLNRSGALMLTLATLTTNFVNIYMSSLAWRSLVPKASDTTAVWSIGLIGTVLSAAPGVWLEQYTSFTIAIGAILVPVGGVLIAHFYLGRRGSKHAATSDAFEADLYDVRGPFRGASLAGLASWGAGIVAFYAAGSIGGTLPALVVSVLTYVMLRK
jgi:NCS1 family nucleobase:cation symporter-1